MKQQPVIITKSQVKRVERLLKEGKRVICRDMRKGKYVEREVHNYFMAVSFFQPA